MQGRPWKIQWLVYPSITIFAIKCFMSEKDRGFVIFSLVLCPTTHILMSNWGFQYAEAFPAINILFCRQQAWILKTDYYLAPCVNCIMFCQPEWSDTSNVLHASFILLAKNCRQESILPSFEHKSILMQIVERNSKNSIQDVINKSWHVYSLEVQWYCSLCWIHLYGIIFRL